MNKEWNFVHSSKTLKDISDLFDESEMLYDLPDHFMMCHIMHTIGHFKSVSEARRNGWDKPIPFGFSTYSVGKKKLSVTIFNKMNPEHEPDGLWFLSDKKCLCGNSPVSEKRWIKNDDMHNDVLCTCECGKEWWVDL